MNGDTLEGVSWSKDLRASFAHEKTTGNQRAEIKSNISSRCALVFVRVLRRQDYLEVSAVAGTSWKT